MGLLDMFKKKGNGGAVQGVSTQPQAVTGVENIAPQSSAVPQNFGEQVPPVAPVTMDQPIQNVAPTVPVEPVQPVASPEVVSQPVAPQPVEMPTAITNNSGMLENNPFVETPVEAPVVESPAAPTPTLDIFTTPPADIQKPLMPQAPVDIQSSEVPMPADVTQPQVNDDVTQSVIDTGAIIDTPQPIAEQQVALNVNPDEIFVGGDTDESKAEAVTQIVSQEIQKQENPTEQTIEPTVAPATDMSAIIPSIDVNDSQTSQDIVNLTSDSTNNDVMKVEEPVETKENAIPIIGSDTQTATEVPQVSDVVQPEVAAEEPQEVTPVVEEVPAQEVSTPVIEAAPVPSAVQAPIVETPQESETQPVVEAPTVQEQPIMETPTPAAIEEPVLSADVQPAVEQPIQPVAVEPAPMPVQTPVVEPQAVTPTQVSQPQVIETPRMKTRFCDNCGEMITDAATVCPNCGSPLS